MFLFKKKNKVERVEKEIDRVLRVIYEKCAYGAQMEALNEIEKNLYLNDIFNKEIQNGGFAMLFAHVQRNMLGEMVDSLSAIKALRCAQLLQEALAMFPQDEDMFYELNEALSAMGEDITVYQTTYMLRHKQELA